MCSPTILRELSNVQRRISTHVVERDVSGKVVVDWALEEQHYLRGANRLTGRMSPMKALLAELPERRYHEECDREEQARMAAGGRSVCEACGERAVLHESVCTYGVPSNINSEWSVIGKCEACGHVDF